MSSTDNSSTPNKYVIDIENGAETARLVEQDKMTTKAMGGLFPELADLPYASRILDIACGPGGWTLEVAFAYGPDVEVVGIDLNQSMINYARALARSQRLQNVAFIVMDIKKPLEFDDSSFDVVNARFIASVMDRASWPVLLAECYRLLRPGGIVRLTEHETGVTNSFSWQKIQEYLYMALAKQGRTFSVDGHSIGMAHMFKALLQTAGFEHVERRPFIIDNSYGSELYEIGRQNAEVGVVLLKPYLVSSNLVEPTEYDKLYQQMLVDMLQEDYTCLSFGLTTWAMKPL